MATYIKTLSDKDGNVILPRTRSSAVYMSDNSTLENYMTKYTQPLGKRLLIEDGTDINSIQNGGGYLCWNATNASTMINPPWKSGGFMLDVYEVPGYKTKMQYAKGIGMNAIANRYSDDGITWTKWKRVDTIQNDICRIVIKNTDFNTITDIGSFVVMSATDAKTCQNAPWTTSGFIFDNIATYNSNTYRVQLAITPDGKQIKCRGYNNYDGINRWSEWYAVGAKVDSDTIIFGNYTNFVQLNAALTTKLIKFLTVYDCGSTYGHNLVISACGNTIVGSGESSYSLYALGADSLSNVAWDGGSEHLAMTSDGNIYFYSACNTIENRKMMTYNTAGALSVPVNTDYTTRKCRNIKFSTSIPTSIDNGEICLVYQ